MKKIVTFGLLVVLSGWSLAAQSYYADQGAVNDSWLQRHYDGYRVNSAGAGNPASDQEKPNAAQQSWLATHYSGQPVEDAAPLQQPRPVVKEPVTSVSADPVKPAEPIAHQNPKTEHSGVPKPVEDAAAPIPSEQHSNLADSEDASPNSEKHTRKGSLPGGMDKGIDDVQEGLSELKGYTKDVTANIQEKGLRGFLDVSPEQKAKGQSIGEKIGHGIRGVMDEVGKEMVGNR